MCTEKIIILNLWYTKYSRAYWVYGNLIWLVDGWKWIELSAVTLILIEDVRVEVNRKNQRENSKGWINVTHETV